MLGSAPMRIPSLLAVVALSVIGCGDNVDPPAAAQRPAAPAANDPAFQIRGLRRWYIIGNPATAGADTLKIVVDAPVGTSFVDAWVGDLAPQRLVPQDGEFALTTSLTAVAAGVQPIIFAADGGDTAFAASSFHRSAPYYVMVSTDWDFSDPGDVALNDIEQLHVHHPIKITNFVGPYTFTDPAVTPERRAAIAAWLVNQRDTHHDEIGLHIHPYCNFVMDAGVDCVTDKSTVYPTDTTGYTIELDAYSRDEMHTLLDHAADLFDANGLGRPTVFRAGGWTLGVETALALDDKGYTADSSALNWARIEEWKGKLLYTWCMEHWTRIGDTSQPYYPTQDATLGGDAAPLLHMLEVPDNGVMIDYVSLAEMTGIFDSNWDGVTPLVKPISLMMGFHPSTSYSPDEQKRVQDFLSYSDKHLANADLGPVIYTTLSDLEPAFPRD